MQNAVCLTTRARGASSRASSFRLGGNGQGRRGALIYPRSVFQSFLQLSGLRLGCQERRKSRSEGSPTRVYIEIFKLNNGARAETVWQNGSRGSAFRSQTYAASEGRGAKCGEAHCALLTLMCHKADGPGESARLCTDWQGANYRLSGRHGNSESR